MKFLSGVVALATTFCMAQAMEVLFDEQDQNRQTCAGMYDKKSWGGPVDPFISVKYIGTEKKEGEDPVSSLLIFEWKDLDLIGIPNPDGYGNTYATCNDDYVKKGQCNSSHIGEFIVAGDADKKSKSHILTQAIHLNDPKPIKYPVKKTGYYCVVTETYTASKYKAVGEFRNAYGELPANQIPKLPFYGGMSILYTLVAGYWGFLYYRHRQDILAVQNYITAILVFLVVEMLLTWGYYDYQNRNGYNVGAKVFLAVVGVLNAARNSFSFFLLLIVCMGYGVVKPTLGRTMIYVRWLAAAHFLFGLVYSIMSHIVSGAPETVGPFILLIVLPLAATLTGFYVWTLSSLNATLKDLRERKQHTKEGMYKKLWWAILLSIVISFAFLFFNSFSFASISDPDFVPFHWKSRWFVVDGWLNIVYFADVIWIAYVWRPTVNNRRFAMSDEIAQDDDGNFEFADIGVPDDFDDDDEEANVGKDQDRPQQQSTGITSSQPAYASTSSGHRALPRDSIEGETIFAVGEDGDKLSDLDSDDEDAKLVHHQ